MAPRATQPVDAARVLGHRHAPTAGTGIRRGLGALAMALLLAATLAASAHAASVGLGTAESFSVLGGSAVTNTGPSTLGGDLGVSPGTAISGFPPGTVSGVVHANDAVALQAQSDLTTAYDDAAGRSSTATVSADLAGQRLTSGVYTSATSLGLSGDLTLDAQGDAGAVFVFQAGSTLTTGTNSRVQLIGGAQACNVFWQVGSSATIGTTTAFTGNILALTSISLKTGATVQGRALARNGAVTLDNNRVTRARCATASGTPESSPGASDGTPISSRSTTTRPPVVTSGSASAVGGHRVRLRGRVRSRSTGSTYYFQYGRTRSYGHRTTRHRAPRAGASARVHGRTRPLKAGRTYHYRLVGVGPGGRKTHGADHTFRTRGRPRGPSSSPARPPHTNSGFTG